MFLNIVLVGFMGAGKSSLGKILAENLGYKFMDTDSIIEQEQGTNISDIFYYAGEKFFRERETKLLHEMRGKKQVVLATGGGIVTTPGNMELLKEIGRVYYLRVSQSIIVDRVSESDNRPLIKEMKADSKKEDIVKLYKERDPSYSQADVIVDINHGQKHQIVGLILQDHKKHC